MATTSQQVINNAFLQALGRPADPSGLEFYTGQLEAGRSVGDILADLNYAAATGVEDKAANQAITASGGWDFAPPPPSGGGGGSAAAPAAQVTPLTAQDLYNQFLSGRPALASDLKFWNDYIAQYGPDQAMAAFDAAAQEERNMDLAARAASLREQNLVREGAITAQDLYNEFLGGRSALPADLDYWNNYIAVYGPEQARAAFDAAAQPEKEMPVEKRVESLREQGLTVPGSLLGEFATQRKATPAEVRAMYLSVLGREPDPEGFAYYTSQPVENLRQRFYEASVPEMTKRVAEIPVTTKIPKPLIGAKPPGAPDVRTVNIPGQYLTTNYGEPQPLTVDISTMPTEQRDLTNLIVGRMPRPTTTTPGPVFTPGEVSAQLELERLKAMNAPATPAETPVAGFAQGGLVGNDINQLLRNQQSAIQRESQSRQMLNTMGAPPVKKFSDGGPAGSPSSGVRRLKMSGYEDGGEVSKDRSYEEMDFDVMQDIRRRRRFTENVPGGLPELLKGKEGSSSTYQALVNPKLRKDYRLIDSDTRGYVTMSPFLQDQYANQALPDEIWVNPDLKNPAETVSHEANHILARKQLGHPKVINDQFDELLGDFKIVKNEYGTEEKVYQGKKREEFVKNASNAYPYLRKKYGLESGYFDPRMLEFQAKRGKLPLLLYEQLATLASIEDTQGVDLTKDPVLRETLFKDKDVRETYNALTGLRMTRLDAKDLPPMTRLPEEDSGITARIKKMLGFSEGGDVSNDAFIQEMMTGTLPTDQGPSPVDTVVSDFISSRSKLFTDPKQFLDKTYENIKQEYGDINKDPKAMEAFLMDNLGFGGLTAYHGGPKLFKQFDPSKRGTGEGFQQYGVGSGYAAEARPVAEGYRRYLGGDSGIRVGNKKLETFQKTLRKELDQAQTAKDQMMVHDKADLLTMVTSSKPSLFGRKSEEMSPQEILKEVKSGGTRQYDPRAVEWLESTVIPNLKYPGYLYKGDIPDEIIPTFLDWDKPLSQQTREVKSVLEKDPIFQEVQDPRKWSEYSGGFIQMNLFKDSQPGKNISGEDLYKFLSLKLESDQAATDYLDKLGLRGIRYLDEYSRGKEKGTSNFVVFRPEDYKVEEINDLPLEEWIKQGKIPGKAKGGEISNDEFIQEMMTGTPPEDMETEPGLLPPELRKGVDVPLDLLNTILRGTAGAVAGPAYGLYKGVTSDKFGTKEGVAEARSEAERMMGEITGEPKTQAAKDIMQFVGEKLEAAKIPPMPQFLTTPAPGPGSASALMRSYELAETPPTGAVKLADKGAKPVATPPTDALGFYSPTEKVVMNLPQEKGTAQQMLAQISKAQGVKPVELRATGLEDYLKGKGNEPVTKQEIQDFLRNNQVQVDEVKLGEGMVLSPEAKRLKDAAEDRMIELDNQLAPYFEKNYAHEKPFMQTYLQVRGPLARKAAKGDAEEMARLDALNLPSDIKQLVLEYGKQRNEYDKYSSQARKMIKPKFDRYNIPGGENAREIYLTLGDRTERDIANANLDAFTNRITQRLGRTGWDFEAMTPDEIAEYDRLNQAVLNASTRPPNPVFTAPNVHSVSPEADKNRLAHIFLDDRTDAEGNKTLFVQELQSDWAQQGRDQGFEIKPTPWEDPAYKSARARTTDLLDEFNINNADPARQAEIRPLLDEAIEIQQSFEGKKGPSRAPFVTNTEDWLNLALKRVIKEAVDSGADNVAFIKGEQAAEKYSLNTVLDSIEVMPLLDNRLVDLKRKGGGAIELTVDNDGKVVQVDDHRFFGQFANKPLSEIIGKEMAEKAMTVKSSKGKESVEFSAEDMVVGGEGMKGFYDNILPKTAEKLLKRLGGGKIEPIEVYQAAPSRMPFESGAFLDWMEKNHPGTSRSDAARAWGMGVDNNQFVKEFYEATKSDKYLGFKITPEMREMVQKEGLPKFAAGGEVTDFIKRAA